MIEIEVKFAINKNSEQRLIKDAQFISEKIITDTYYDTDDLSLTSRDIWFRRRNRQFELKIPLHPELNSDKRFLDQYDELKTKIEIRKALHIPKRKVFVKDLKDAGYKPFATLATTRRTYKKEGFTIVVDSLDFGYNVVEVELLVKKPSDMENAKQKIIQFAKQNCLPMKKARGKVVEYIRKNRPQHFQALIRAGVVDN